MASPSETSELMTEISVFLYPILRLLVAFGVVWYCSNFSKYVGSTVEMVHFCVPHRLPCSHTLRNLLYVIQKSTAVFGYCIGHPVGLPHVYVFGTSLCVDRIRRGHGIPLPTGDQRRHGGHESGRLATQALGWFCLGLQYDCHCGGLCGRSRAVPLLLSRRGWCLVRGGSDCLRQVSVNVMECSKLRTPGHTDTFFLSLCRFGSTFFLSMAVAIEAGAIAACLVIKPMMPFLMDVTRGYPYYPNQPEDYSVSVGREIEYALVCLLGALLVVAGSIYRAGTAAHFSPFASQNGYSAIPTGDTSYKRDSLPPYRDPPVNHEAYNMFDSADLPPRLTEYANMVYTACEDLGNFFGFQDSSVRNQAEHLLILLSNNRRYMSSHILPPSVQPPSPIHALHAKVFSNYVKWCRAMAVPPHFSKMNSSMNAPPAVASRVVDLVLYFCVWGEASNLRHMPECLWFLYHKMMEEYIRSEGYTQTRSLYAGHYLDNVVTPIYDIVQKVS